MSAENLNIPNNSPQTKLFDGNGEPTPESLKTGSAELSPTEKFLQLGRGTPIDNGLNTDDEINKFLVKIKGMSNFDISTALIALREAKEDGVKSEHAWQDRADLK